MAEVEGINAGNYEQRIRELRTYGQTLRSQDARDIINGVITLLQTAWNIEQHNNPTAMKGTTTEQRSNR